MKIETAVLAGLVVLGTNLLARMAVQGVEQALVAIRAGVQIDRKAPPQDPSAPRGPPGLS